MGCRKITYHPEGEGLEKSTVHFLGELEEKKCASKFCYNYYPFGLTMNGAVNSPNVTNTAPNNRLFNAGSELQELSNLYDTYYRQYDASLGRFNAIDVKAAKYSSTTPYNYAFSDPIGLNDPLGDDPNGGGYDGYGNSAYHYFKDQYWPKTHYLMPMRKTFGVTVSDFSYTGPGSGDYWNDGIGFDDWNGSTGSASYRRGKDAGLHEWGGEFFTFDNEGNRINIEQSNGELLVPVTSWTEVEYSDGITRNKNIRTEYVTLDQAREDGLISGGNKCLTCFRTLPMNTWDEVTDNRLSKLNYFARETAIMFINQVESELGIKLRVTDGYRTPKEQNALYAVGRSHQRVYVMGMEIVILDTRKKLTNAKAWQSYHNYGLAFDVVEIKNGEANYNTDWENIGRIGKELGLEWGGDWRSKDRPHFQYTFDRSIEWLYNNYR